MKKILFLINKLGCGGAEKVLVDLVNNLNNENFLVTVMAIENGGDFVQNVNKDVRLNFINTIKNKFFRKVFNKLLFSFFSARFVYNRFVKDDYDIEVAFLEGLPTKIISASTNKKAKKVAWVHTDFTNFFDSVKTFKNKEKCFNVYKKFDKIACVSEGVKNGFINKFGAKLKSLETVYNIIDEKSILVRSKRKIPIKRPNGLLFVTCGRLTYQKGYDRLLAAIDKLLKEGYKFSLWVVGDGIEKNNLQNFIDKKRIQESVKLIGYSNNPYKYMSKADLFISSSRVEGFSTVVTEAQILGIPVLSTKVSGTNEPKNHNRENVVCANNKSALYNSIKKILDNRKILEEYKKQQKEKRMYFTKENLVKKIEDFLEN